MQQVGGATLHVNQAARQQMGGATLHENRAARKQMAGATACKSSCYAAGGLCDTA